MGYPFVHRLGLGLQGADAGLVAKGLHHHFHTHVQITVEQGACYYSSRPFDGEDPIDPQQGIVVLVGWG